MSSFRQGTREFKIYLKRTYLLARPYWQSEQRVMAWALLLSLLVLVGFVVYMNVKVSYATAALFDAMDARNFDMLWVRLGIFLGLMTALIFAMLIDLQLRNVLIIHWRRFMTERYLGEYLSDDLYNQLELKDYKLDNPDQRIAMDLYDLASYTFNNFEGTRTLNLLLGFLTAVGRIIVFGVILWQVGGALEFRFVGYDVTLPGYMFWFAIIYAVFATWVTHRLAAPMTRLNFEKQAAEADFRYHLLRMRENAESIALLSGEEREKTALLGKFGAIWDNWMLLLKYKKRIQGMQFAQRNLSSLFPYVAVMPTLLSGAVGLGGFLQLKNAFSMVEIQMSWFVFNYDLLAEWKSSVDRIISLEDALRAARVEREQCRIDWRSGTQTGFKIDNLSVELPSGEQLLEDLHLTLEAGKNVVVTGPSGCGKSTFFKTLSSLWIWGQGVVTKPQGETMFIPQKAYLPIDCLRNVLTYPNSPEGIDDARMKEVMRLCLLDKFVDQLDEHCDWARAFSGGEQQRLSFVRAILAKPDWLFLDEATAALDPLAEAAVYMALKSELPHTTLISITHRESLKKYHDLQVQIDTSTRSMSIGALQPEYE